MKEAEKVTFQIFAMIFLHLYIKIFGQSKKCIKSVIRVAKVVPITHHAGFFFKSYHASRKNKTLNIDYIDKYPNFI